MRYTAGRIPPVTGERAMNPGDEAGKPRNVLGRFRAKAGERESQRKLLPTRDAVTRVLQESDSLATAGWIVVVAFELIDKRLDFLLQLLKRWGATKGARSC